MRDATIGIITCKRSLWLKRLLDSLNEQHLENNINIDVLVIDNASDMKTKEVVSTFADSSSLEVTYATEIDSGIVAARNKCVEIFLKSDSKNLFFIDDDEWPKHNDWVMRMLTKKEMYSADIATSDVLSIGEEGTPEWAVKLMYRRRNQREGDSVKIFYTGNLLLSRRVFEEIRPAFDVRFALTGASDYHFALKCKKKGFKAIYVDAPVEEEFPQSRATAKWFAQRGFRSGVGFTRAHLFEENVFIALLKSLIMFNVRMLVGIFYFFIGMITFNMVKTVKGLFKMSSAIGTIAGIIGIKYNEYNVIHGK